MERWKLKVLIASEMTFNESITLNIFSVVFSHATGCGCRDGNVGQLLHHSAPD